MEAHRDSLGHFISGVESGSPAEAAGLLDGDRIVEVNGENVEKAGHGEVVDKIKTISNEVTLLVVDRESDQFFTDNNDIIASSMNSVQTISCPQMKPAAQLIGWYQSLQPIRNGEVLSSVASLLTKTRKWPKLFVKVRTESVRRIGTYVPSNAMVFGSTGVSTPSRTSIRLAVFALCTAKPRQTDRLTNARDHRSQ